MLNIIKCKLFGHPLFRYTSCPFTMTNYFICDLCGYIKNINQRKLLNGEIVESYEKAIDLTIHTKSPAKWKLVDMETGQEYVGSAKPNKYGKWIRIKNKQISID
jgi:hypothetical protein